MRTVNQRLNVKAGDTWNDFSVIWKDSGGVVVDLTGYTAKLTVRATAAIGATIILDLTSAGGKLTIEAANGKIIANASAADMALAPGKYFYDLQVTSGAVVTTLLEGEFWVHAQVAS